MNKALADLIKISNITGSDSSLVQGGGGNTSAKTGDGKFMYIKASGTALKSMDKESGWRRMNICQIHEIVNDKKLSKLPPAPRETEVVNRLLSACDDNLKTTARPSVEAHLHALLDRYVIHLHPNAVGAYVNAKEGKKVLERLFKAETYPPLWVPYVDPGLMLALKIKRLVDDYKSVYNRMPTILFLEKHGLFVTASTADSALRIVKKVIQICNKKLHTVNGSKKKTVCHDVIQTTGLAIRGAYVKTTGETVCLKHYCDEAVAAFMRNKNASKMLAAGSLTPDELIYANGPTMWIEKFNKDKLLKKLRMLRDKNEKIPASYLVKGQGLFVLGSIKMIPTTKEIIDTSLFIRSNAWKMGGIAALNKRQKEFILNWESEAFRKKLAAGDSAGQVKDKICLVTGAGSGICRAIAIGLVKAGAMVVLADIDIKAAQETEQIISDLLPGSSTLVSHCNVTDELSVQKAYQQVLATWGGLDVLVNAAGVAPAYPLVDTPVDKWRFALEVNLTGYMLMAKYAARIMINQDMGGSIVNLSSKSGIDASKNNSAYNATKAGELHLTRGWAMELGKHNIRVNSVCPGNVFEGSKIWNPEYIRTCAKKYSIKPEEVIPYYISKTMLNLEIKGQDIADAVVYLCSEKARRVTAQTLVVDAGQAIVR